MEIAARKHGPLLEVTVMENRIDAACAIQFKERMREVTETPSDRVLLDLSQVQFLDSSGLGAVVAVRKHLGEERPLDLTGLTPTVQKVFRLTRMDTVFTILPSGGLRDAG
ncbi:STAS domain-containing protein [Szabonella alba]|uniref:STAS domain-containing protein n=1 Tax=Szabonella alba TaxID=2804194 RepID=A0A8K0VCK1_9RHOB|nr:STAS domain-containing protein [Szabonella alba]MBL4916660.1 STAS domain-containing protein [Szabonella alba]